MLKPIRVMNVIRVFLIIFRSRFLVGDWVNQKLDGLELEFVADARIKDEHPLRMSRRRKDLAFAADRAS